MTAPRGIFACRDENAPSRLDIPRTLRGHVPATTTRDVSGGRSPSLLSGRVPATFRRAGVLPPRGHASHRFPRRAECLGQTVSRRPSADASRDGRTLRGRVPATATRAARRLRRTVPIAPQRACPRVLPPRGRPSRRFPRRAECLGQTVSRRPSADASRAASLPRLTSAQRGAGGRRGSGAGAGCAPAPADGPCNAPARSAAGRRRG